MFAVLKLETCSSFTLNNGDYQDVLVCVKKTLWLLLSLECSKNRFINGLISYKRSEETVLKTFNCYDSSENKPNTNLFESDARFPEIVPHFATVWHGPITVGDMGMTRGSFLKRRSRPVPQERNGDGRKRRWRAKSVTGVVWRVDATNNKALRRAVSRRWWRVVSY